MKDLTQWYAPDGSGAQLATQYPPSVVEVTPDHWQALDALDPRLADSFGDTDLLRAAIRSWDRPPDTARVLNGVARLATWRSPRRLDRGMLLTVLAELPGLLYYQRVADRAGRPGIGLAVTSVYGTRRGLLILHPDTGEALAYESAHRSGVGWRVTTYILYLTHSHAPARWWEPPNLPPRAKAPRPRLYPHLKRSWLVPTDEPCHITTPPTRGETR